MLRTNIFASVTCFLWVLALWLGIGLIDGVTRQNVPGYPNSGQMTYYVFIPAGVVLILVSTIAHFNFVKRSPRILTIISVLALLYLPFYLILSGGGM
jgi:hypothetical protein